MAVIALALVFILAAVFLGYRGVGEFLKFRNETFAPDIERRSSHKKATGDGNEGA